MAAADARRTLRFTPATARMVKPGPGITPAPTTPRRGSDSNVRLARPAPPAIRPSGSQRPSTARPAHPRATFAWLRAHKALTAVVALLLATATVGIAAVVFGQSFTATPTTRTSPIAFASGDDVTDLDLLDFVDAPVISASGATASITLYGIPGASSLALGEVLELVNADTADNLGYAVTLSVTGSPAASLTGFTITFDDSGTLRTWNLLTTPSFGPFTLADGETWEFNVASLLMSAVASGSQGVLTIAASMTPV